MNIKSHSNSFFLLALLSSIAHAQDNFSVQIGNKDNRGSAELYTRFTIVAELDTDNRKEEKLNEDALAVFAGDPAQVNKLAWEYDGPTYSFVLYPAFVSSAIHFPCREFTLERPEDLKVRASNRIQRKMNESRVDAWKLARSEVRNMQTIFNQTKEIPEVIGDLSPTPLRRYYLSLLHDCSSPKGWDGKWDERASNKTAKDLYYECAHDHGLEMVKHAAKFCDPLTRQHLANGMDAWFHSHEKRRTDAWRDCLVKDIGNLPDWGGKNDFRLNLLDVLISLQIHYDTTKTHSSGLENQMTARIGNYGQGWDEKMRSGLEKLNDMLTNRLSDNDNALAILDEMRLSEWENVIDALKLLYTPPKI